MKNLRILLALIVCLRLFSVSVDAQNDLQAKFDSITPRYTNINYIENILGKTDSKKFIRQWQGKLRSDGSFEGVDKGNATNCRNDAANGFITRNLYKIDYPQIGLSVMLFDNPWLVSDVTATSEKISLFGIKVGDDLDKVQNKLGEGEWRTTDENDYWTLEFEKKGARFLFERDYDAPKYPLKLSSGEKVVEIQKYDNKSSFSGCGGYTVFNGNNLP